MAAPAKRLYDVFVSHVPWTVANRQLKEYFSQFGLVKQITLPFDKETGFHKGFSWVRFASEEGFQNALQKDTHVLDGVKVRGTLHICPFKSMTR
uniref:SRA stem-loop interacting RNA binding protein n=1 Tax=Leptobrachium leishanense TaxID=445787 RepID=A0A8C5R838_9ANUR